MLLKTIFIVLFVFIFSGCNTQKKPHLDGEKLLEQKCASCHNLDLPPKTFVDEKAPPMMAVSFHIVDYIHASSESDKIPKAIEFVKDYVIYPSASKAFCDRKSLESYGLMPSQKGLVTEDELEAIASYMFAHYTLKNLTQAQTLQNKLNKMPKGERLALKHNCLSCHKVDKDLVGPSFERIANRYKGDIMQMQKSIKNGSAKQYENFRGAIMPAFGKQLNDKEIETLSRWIAESAKEQ